MYDCAYSTVLRLVRSDEPTEPIRERVYLLSEGVILDRKTGRTYDPRRDGRDTYDPAAHNKKVLAPEQERMREYDKAVRTKGWILPPEAKSKYRADAGKQLIDLRIGYIVMPTDSCEYNEINLGPFSFQIERSDIGDAVVFYSPARSQMDANHSRRKSGLFMPSHSIRLPNIDNPCYDKEFKRDPDESAETFETITRAVRLRNLASRNLSEYRRIVNNMKGFRRQETECDLANAA